MSSKKLKAADYHRTTQEWDRNFQRLGLARPQDQNRELLQRNRQINFGLISVTENKNKRMIESFEPAKEALKPKNKFKCYPNGKANPVWIDTKEKFEKLMDRLRKCDEFSLDLEMHSHRTQTGKKSS